MWASINGLEQCVLLGVSFFSSKAGPGDSSVLLPVLHPFSWLCSIPLMALTDVFAHTAIGGRVARAFSSTPPTLVVTQGCFFPSSRG